MNQDITESLRIMASNLKWTSGQHTADLLNDAADEIENLRKQIKGYQNAAKAIKQLADMM